MSTDRKQRETGWGPARKDEAGKPVCRRCAGPIPKQRQTFCGKACVHEWRLRTDPGYVRLIVFERDHGVCAACGIDTMANRLRKSARGSGDVWQADHIVPVAEGGGECGIENYRTLCTGCHKRATAELKGRLARRAAEAALALPADRATAELKGRLARQRPAQPELFGMQEMREREEGA